MCGICPNIRQVQPEYKRVPFPSDLIGIQEMIRLCLNHPWIDRQLGSQLLYGNCSFSKTLSCMYDLPVAVAVSRVERSVKKASIRARIRATAIDDSQNRSSRMLSKTRIMAKVTLLERITLTVMTMTMAAAT